MWVTSDPECEAEVARQDARRRATGAQMTSVSKPPPPAMNKGSRRKKNGGRRRRSKSIANKEHNDEREAIIKRIDTVVSATSIREKGSVKAYMYMCGILGGHEEV